MSTLKIIASAAYLDQELSAEFGKIPPAFLPIGVSRLYEKQIDLLGPGTVYLTLPESFLPMPSDLQRLKELGAVIVPVPDGLLLGESVVYALNTIDDINQSVCILHGDTLIDGIHSTTCSANTIAIFKGGDDYSWATADVRDQKIVSIQPIDPNNRDEEQLIVCGYFVFQDRMRLIRALTRVRGNFVEGLNAYCQECEVQAISAKYWRDFGHIQTYFRSRREILTARSFNELTIQGATVRKSSQDQSKMRSEFYWFSEVPSSIKPYTARALDLSTSNSDTSYMTEYQYAPTLSELLVFSSIGRPTWNNIFRSCREFLTQCNTFKSKSLPTNSLDILVTTKTLERLQRFEAESKFSITDQLKYQGKSILSLAEIANRLVDYIDTDKQRDATVMHGDFCFSNILYNSRSARIIVIDPRGYIEKNRPTIYGDLRYDLAKFSHSIEGRYDHILAGRYYLTGSGTRDMSIEFEKGMHDYWLNSLGSNFDVDGIKLQSAEIRAITISLFLSMLPLHSDRPDRQQAFIANALRLFIALEDA